MLMPNWLAQRAATTPKRAALIGTKEEWSFEQLNDRALQSARRFGTLGIKKGDVVALLLQNGLHFPLILHALHYVGAVVVPLNTRLTPNELTFQLIDSHTVVLVHDSSTEEVALEIGMEDINLHIISYDNLSALDETNIDIQFHVHSDDIHTIMYTSGTTGKPKGVMLTFGNHWSSAIGSVLNLGLLEDDRWLICTPLFHMSGLSILIRSVIYGIPAVIHEKFEPSAVNRAIRNDCVTIVSVVSAMVSRMLDALGEGGYPEHFRCMLLGGGPAPLALLELCQNRNIPVFQTYGMTETASQIVTLSSEYMLTKLGSAGKPLFGAELRIEQDGESKQAGEVGEIVVRGPNVTNGYLNRQEATAEAIKNGWLYTGDIGYVDEEGFLYVLDRRSDLIISGGENVYPAEIEAILIAHPAIVEAGVTGIEDKRWGQVPVAFIKLREGVTLTQQAVLTYCGLKLAKYKIPSYIYFVDSLPRNASNKLLRRELLRLLEK